MRSPKEQGKSKSKHEQRFDISLLMTDNAQILILNQQYRDKDAPTDVLSFPMEDDLMSSLSDQDNRLWQTDLPLVLGDIVISVERAYEQAQEYGHSIERELVFLFVHGLLHLMGYDHERSLEEETKMFQLQDEILSEMNL